MQKRSAAKVDKRCNLAIKTSKKSLKSQSQHSQQSQKRMIFLHLRRPNLKSTRNLPTIYPQVPANNPQQIINVYSFSEKGINFMYHSNNEQNMFEISKNPSEIQSRIQSNGLESPCAQSRDQSNGLGQQPEQKNRRTISIYVFKEIMVSFRRRIGMTQVRLSQKSGISERTIQNIERGDGWIMASTARAIARALRIDVNELLVTPFFEKPKSYRKEGLDYCVSPACFLGKIYKSHR